MMNKFSIMIPTFGRPQLLKYAVASALAQKGPIDMEVVVVDNDHDAKFDAEEVIAKFSDSRLRYVRNAQNLGMCGNWNECIALANGEWMTILHDDDILHSEYVASLVKHIDAIGPVSVVGCGVTEISHGDGVTESDYVQHARDSVVRLNDFDVLRCCPYYPVGVAFKRSSALALGGFSPSMYPSMDYDMWSRLVQGFGGALMTKRLAFYRKFQNESARGDVLANFLNQSNVLRKQIITKYPNVWRYFLNTYSNRRTVEDKSNLEVVWSAKIDDSLVHGLASGQQLGRWELLIARVVKAYVVLRSGRRRFKLAA